MDTQVVLITLIAYKLLLVLIGLWAQRRVSSEQDFFLAGRQLGPWVAGVSYAASAASAWTLLGMSGLAYSLGVSSIWLALGAILGCAISWWVVAPRIMNLAGDGNLLSATELVSMGTHGRQRNQVVWLTSLIILFCFVIYIASQFQGAGNTFSTTFGMDSAQSIALGGLVILVYTLLGGFWAVSLTDTLQGLLMIATAVLLPVAAVSQAGGFSAFFSALAEISSADYMSVTADSAGLALIGMVVGSLSIGISSLGQPHLVARFMALRDRKALQQAQIIATSWYAIVFLGMWLVGLAGKLLVGEIDNSEGIFFAVNEALFPSFMGAVLLAAVLSAIMSTADSMLLVTGTTVAHDLGLNRGKAWSALTISRVVIALISAAAILVAITVPATIFERVLFAWVAIGSALGPNILCRALGRQIAPGRVLPAMFGGFAAALVFYSLPNTPGDIAERTLPFLLGMVILLAPGTNKNRD